jgi:hypothetical protein
VHLACAGGLDEALLLRLTERSHRWLDGWLCCNHFNLVPLLSEYVYTSIYTPTGKHYHMSNGPLLCKVTALRLHLHYHSILSLLLLTWGVHTVRYQYEIVNLRREYEIVNLRREYHTILISRVCVVI